MVRAPWRRAAEAIRRDWSAFTHQVGLSFRANGPRPGLRTYRFRGNGGERRLHLRVHEDGTGLLFVDVTHAIHLTPSGALIGRLLLDGLSPAQVERLLRARHPEAPPDEIGADVHALAEVITSLKQPGSHCPTCLPQLDRAGLYAHRAQAPYKADLALTYACNNRCAHCYNEAGRKGLASFDQRGWQEVLRHLKGIGVPHIIFTGGEPTLVDFLPALIRAASRNGQVTGVNTNGRRLAEAGVCERLKAAGLDHVQITLASHRPDLHDATVGARAHAETVQGIRNTLDAGLHTITNTTLTRSNAEEACQTAEFVHGLGVRTFAMNGMICSGGGRHNPDALSEEELVPVLDSVLERAADLGMRFLWYTPTEYCRLSPLELGLGAKTCNAAEYSICIEPNGDVLPCQSYYQPAGNLLRDDWSAIWNSALFTRIRMRREDPRRAGLDERCYDCPDLEVCGGGCPLQRAERRKEAFVHGR